MLVETGWSTLKIDDEGKKYWDNYDEGAKDSVAMNVGECIELNPDSFEEGTIIVIKEEVG